ADGDFLQIKRIMGKAPDTEMEVGRLKRDIYDNPLFVEKIISQDGKGVAIYIPVQKKDMSYRISKEIEKIVEGELDGTQRYYLAGLPVAEDTFGNEMFKQMGLTAPLTGLVIFLLMFLLFRKLTLVISPLFVAMFSVVWGLGLLIGLGFTVHIMSSMIPIFLMPIAVLDSVHILSEFYDLYPSTRDRRKTLMAVTDQLFTPMLYTSITSAVGFASLTLAPIPPVRVFGVFVAFGIMAAWLLTITLVPASIMLIREEKMERSLVQKRREGSFLDKILSPIGRFSFFRRRTVVLAAALTLALGIWGVSRIVINDNPVKWFKKGSKIRVADTEMNRLFGGTYMAYLVAKGEGEEAIKRPDVMEYIDRLQDHLEEDDLVGKTSSVGDIVKRINYVLHREDKAFDRVPKSREEIGQYLFLFLSSGDPNDLDNFVDNDYKDANIWVQMKRGENRDMERIALKVREYSEQNPLPEGVRLQWSGLTYINKVWQDLMVGGMLKAVLGSFAVVLVLMIILFRSFGLGFISMIPLTFAIVLSYGIVGFIGKDYDMPIAVCSSLSLGLAIDFAIHFLQRFKRKYEETGDLERTNDYIFGEPAKAISRNGLVIIIGFLPLTLSTLTPYVTVGTFFASLMIFSTLSTLFLLPALMGIVGGRLLKGGRR
ncbi:MAG: RND family transporter, partial [Thermodesulfobacteriota bacterium]